MSLWWRVGMVADIVPSANTTRAAVASSGPIASRPRTAADVSDNVDITSTFKAVIDMENIEIGNSCLLLALRTVAAFAAWYANAAEAGRRRLEQARGS